MGLYSKLLAVLLLLAPVCFLRGEAQESANFIENADHPAAYSIPVYVEKNRSQEEAVRMKNESLELSKKITPAPSDDVVSPVEVEAKKALAAELSLASEADIEFIGKVSGKSANVVTLKYDGKIYYMSRAKDSSESFTLRSIRRGLEKILSPQKG